MEGRAYHFDGIGDYIEGPNFIAQKNNKVSLSVWIEAADNVDQHFIMSNDFAVGQSYSTAYFAISIPATSSAHSQITLGTWVHLVGTYNGSDIRIYRNGVLQETKNHPGSLGTKDRNFAVGYFSKYWHGSVDDLRVYSYVLSEAEILKLAAQ